MKPLLVIFLVLAAFSAQARHYQGVDNTGNRCSIIIKNDRYIDYEVPERRVRTHGSFMSTSERLTNVEVRLFREGQIVSEDFEISSRYNDSVELYSTIYSQSDDDSSSTLNVTFRTSSRFSEIVQFRLEEENGTSGKKLIPCFIK